MPATSAGVDGPPRWARPFVWTLLAAVLLCGVAGVEDIWVDLGGDGVCADSGDGV